MSDSKQSITGKEKYQEGWIGVPALEKDKHTKDEFSQTTASDLLYSAFVILLKQFTARFSENKHANTAATQETLHTVEVLRQLLLTLSCEDKSHDPEFTAILSSVWHQLAQTPMENIPEWLTLKEDIRNYPPLEQHSLDYYLTSDVGTQWHPFPFMEMLRKLHQNHQANPAASELHHWINILDDILSNH